jgi:hypothetical protein
MSGSLVRRRIPKKIWNSYFKFCVERNPWDKTLSHFYMMKGRSDDNLTLEEYFQNKNFCLNYPIYTVGDEIIVDRVVKYENLNNGLNDIFDKLGIPFKGELGVRAKSGHRKNESYRDALNSDQSHTIQNYFRKEIKMHGYSY